MAMTEMSGAWSLPTNARMTTSRARVVIEARCAEDDVLMLTGHLDLDSGDVDVQPEDREP